MREPKHVVIETARVNQQRNSCAKVAIKPRKVGGKVQSTYLHDTPTTMPPPRGLFVARRVLVKSFIACHKISVVDLEESLEEELQDAGILGETDDNSQPFVAHPNKYFHFGGEFPANFGTQRVRKTSLFRHTSGTEMETERG